MVNPSVWVQATAESIESRLDRPLELATTDRPWGNRIELLEAEVVDCVPAKLLRVYRGSRPTFRGRVALMRKFVWAALATLLSGLALAPAPAASQEVTLRLHSFLPPVANPMKHFLIPWAEQIEKDSKGRIKIQVFPSMQLGGKAEQLLTQVRDGVVDVAWALPGFTPGVMPKLEIFELPFLHRSTRATVMSLQ